MQAESKGGGWQCKTAAERKAILGTIKGAGRLNCSWKRTAALLDIHETTLIRWRKDDPEGKIDTAHEAGKAEAGKEVLDNMMEVARDPEAQGRSTVLVHLSKHLCNMGDKSTHQVVTPSDLAGGDTASEQARRREALSILGLGALMGGGDDSDDG